ncbi:unnamed protein product, partial [Coregonus sp. 'balchen']
MAAHTLNKSMLSLGQINGRIYGINVLNPLNRATYATALSTNNSSQNKGFPDRGNRRPRRAAGDPRTDRMAVDQDWTAVYPTAAPFRQGSVPLPVRIGFPVKRGVPPEKKGNLELVKSKDYVSAGTSLRNPSARIVHLRVKLSSLNLDDHARKKMVKLVGERYCKETDTLTITTDSCPVRQQNYDYAMYLLTVLYHESWKVEAWESEKTVADMEEYSWENSPSQKNALSTLDLVWAAGEAVREELLGRPEVQEYRDSVTTLKNEGESEGSVLQYREAVVLYRPFLFLRPLPAHQQQHRDDRHCSNQHGVSHHVPPWAQTTPGGGLTLATLAAFSPHSRCVVPAHVALGVIGSCLLLPFMLAAGARGAAVVEAGGVVVVGAWVPRVGIMVEEGVD